MTASVAATNLKWWAQPRILLVNCLLLLSPESENKLNTHLFFATLGRVAVLLTVFLVAVIVCELLNSKIRSTNSAGFARNASYGKTGTWRPKRTRRKRSKKNRSCKKTKRRKRRNGNSTGSSLTRAPLPVQPAVPQLMRRSCYRISDTCVQTAQSLFRRLCDNTQTICYTVFRIGGQSEDVEHQQRCLERLGVLMRIPRRPDMAAAATRLKTFCNWPYPQSLAPERMAEAGFYYTGLRDVVCCFFCNQHLEKWEATDDPWEEHCHHYPRCPYVQFVKAHLPAGSLTVSDGDMRRLMDMEQSRARQPARERDDRGLRSRCWGCNTNDRQVVFPCGHKNVCWECYQCPRFLTTCSHTFPTCHDCQRPFTEVFQDPIIQTSVMRLNQTRRVRSGQKGRCC